MLCMPMGQSPASEGSGAMKIARIVAICASLAWAFCAWMEVFAVFGQRSLLVDRYLLSLE